MFKGFPTQKSKMSQGEEEEEGENEVQLGLPCGRQKAVSNEFRGRAKTPKHLIRMQCDSFYDASLADISGNIILPCDF